MTPTQWLTLTLIMVAGLTAIWWWADSDEVAKSSAHQAAASRADKERARVQALREWQDAQETLAAHDPTPQTVEVVVTGWHPCCGKFEETWTQPHPAAIAERILRVYS